MSHLGDMLDEWSSSHRFQPSQSDIARLVGVTKGTVGGWRQGAMPQAEHLRAIARETGLPYASLLTATLRDRDYLAPEESVHVRRAPIAPPTDKPSPRLMPDVDEDEVDDPYAPMPKAAREGKIEPGEAT